VAAARPARPPLDELGANASKREVVASDCFHRRSPFER